MPSFLRFPFLSYNGARVPYGWDHLPAHGRPLANLARVPGRKGRVSGDEK